MVFYQPTSNIALAGKTLIVPIVSTANVSQLAADLLIASFELKCVGLFDTRYMIPVIGSGEDGDGITTALELYGRDGVDVVVMLPRSPVMKHQKEEFISALFEFIGTSQFSAVLFLSGVDVSNRTDDQMTAPTYYIKPPNTPAWDNTPLATISNLPLPPYTSPVSQYPLSPQNEGPIPFIPGGGLTRRILNTLPAQSTTPTGALLQFVVEGDNRTDAAFMASVVAKVLSLDGAIGELKEPKSWKQGLFGTPQDQTLYG